MSSPVEIIPAILPASRGELERELMRVRGRAPSVQVDFVTNNCMAGQEVFPLWEEFDFECDLMLAHPAAEVEALAVLGASRIVVHLKNPEARGALELLQPLRAGEFPLGAGVALAAHDKVEALDAVAGLFDFVQVMGIDREGVQGEPLDPHGNALGLIAKLRHAHPGLVIQVDGGVRLENARTLARAGANRLVAGSAIFGAHDALQALEDLRAEANA